ncbi:stage II sporulation protein D [Irregularibacter muris]|uniref:Stage II sporulation protein D n=1 Tax=Irregularibacter muris TaxID=1796619 RepID=A0AAE3HJ82_9FIRM|nr:stage II sporulation protein D [Irregularibacter muris]MCR1900193.1 stage II sporulation protein D [Irregularibacter muris]
MKFIGYTVLTILIIVIIIPTFIVKGCNIVKKEDNYSLEPPDTKITLKVLNHQNNEVMELGLEEYIVGVVAAEMPVTFELEALKAQAIAARTYTVMRLQQFGAAPNEKHPQYDMCTDHTHCQAWIGKQDRINVWKKDKELGLLDYVTLWKRLEEAVGSTRGKVITYNGELIDPLFHSTSGGKTENSEDYFSSKVPYLRSVISKHEEHSPHMVNKTTMTTDQFVSKLKEKMPDIKIDTKKLAQEIKILEKTEGGHIKNIQIGNKTLKGREAREALGLKSSNFTVEIKGKEVFFTVTGYGHGVGMSQYGADGMAKEGAKDQEIIKHYYQDVEIVDIYDKK